MNINIKNSVFQSFNKRSFLITIKKNYNALFYLNIGLFFYRKKNLTTTSLSPQGTKIFWIKKCIYFIWKVYKVKTLFCYMILWILWISGDGQFWFYEIIVCNILVEPPLSPRYYHTIFMSNLTLSYITKYRNIY